MKIIILLVILGFIGILLFALGIITGVAVATELNNLKKEETENER